MKVCIAEKPSVAREIANILGAKNKKDGYFEGEGYCVTWTFGHFCSLYAPGDYQLHWKYWELQNLPMLPERFETKLIDDEGVKKQFKVIESLFSKAEVVINCGDAGQEGELIQRWVLKQAGYKGTVQRLWISSLTPEAIKEGFDNLKDATDYDHLYYAGSSRAIGDWLLGMNATRLYTLKYAGPRQVLSIGRVQTPTLAMLVDRYKEIQNFKPEPYWELQTEYRGALFNNEQGRFKSKEEGERLLEQVKGKDLYIKEVSKKKGKEQPPSLFDLTSLQVYCNNKFAFTADQTLKIVQKLYEQKLVTYPRVDTTYLPLDMYPKIGGILNNLSAYSKLTEPLKSKPIRKSSKVFNDKKVTDHHAIIPTGIESTLGIDDQRVYDSITRHFIAAFYPDCLVSNTTALAEVEEVKFKATGKEILDQGWRVVMNTSDDKTKNKKEEDKILPNFEQGEYGPHKPSFWDKQTSPPRNYTEASLLRAMETAGKKVDDDELRHLMKANGIGRPSTRASIIETLFKRNYIRRNKKQILPTELGIRLIDIIQNELLKSVELTGQWEKRLKEIEEGEFKPGTFIANMKRMVYDLVKEVRMAKSMERISAEKIEADLKARKSKRVEKEYPCPKCQQGKLLKGQSAYGCNRWKDGCKFLIPMEYMHKKISDKQLIRIIEKGSTVLLKGFKNENGDKANGKLVINENAELIFEQEESQQKASTHSNKMKCPKCANGEIIKGQTAYGCSNWKQGCNFRFEFNKLRAEAGSEPLTKELVEQILNRAYSS
jgi:DNA topoisomerase-3